MFIIITSRPEFLIHVELTQKNIFVFYTCLPKVPLSFWFAFFCLHHSVEKSLLEGLHLRKNRHFFKGDFYSLCVSQKVLISLTFFLLFVHQLLFSCPITVKIQCCTLVLVTLPMEKLCVCICLSLSYLYYCCCIILSRIALYCWQNNSYLGVIHLLYYLKWSSGTKSPYCFFSPRLTTKPCLLYYIYSLSQTNHVAKSYCTSLTVL